MKPEVPREERSDRSAPTDTDAHPAKASLWERTLSRENLAAALRRVEQNAGAPGVDGIATRQAYEWDCTRKGCGRLARSTRFIAPLAMLTGALPWPT